jgi:hypothetical protein
VRRVEESDYCDEIQALCQQQNVRLVDAAARNLELPVWRNERERSLGSRKRSQ